MGFTQNNDSAVYWLILATSISSITTAVLYLFQKCCGQFWGNIGNVCFQSFAARLELREETFNQVTNLLIFPRLFQQLQLQTFKVIWNHDANAQTGDFVQWGWLRLPTRSYFLTFLAVCGVTHYVYIPFDLKSVAIVGPANAITKLIDLSNVAATTRLTEPQLNTLRCAFGMDNAWTEADKVCTHWERRFVFSMLSMCFMWMGYVLKASLVRIIAVLVGVVVAVVCAWWFKSFAERRVLAYLPWCRRREEVRDDIEVALIETDSGHSADGDAAPHHLIETMATDNAQVVQQTNHAQHDSHTMLYSVLTARVYYYEVVKQTKVVSRDNDLLVYFKEEAQLHAVQLRPNFVHNLAERTKIPPDASLHICVHNPMIDPYLTEVYQNFQKGVDRDNLLLIVLPPLDHFNACFQSPIPARTRTAVSTQFVTTLDDFETLLLKMTAGFQ